MEVREAKEEDIPAIVNLLKLSLGESLMPKSEKYWRWKHLENPFGPSLVLLCHEGDSLIGVRAFMRWEWSSERQVYRAVRAVDTATHPDHQGKGIFKKLTLSLVETCTKQGIHFVYNTPNQQSKPGYLKMGWEEAGRIPLRIAVNKPFSIVRNLVAGTRSSSDHEDDSIDYYLQHPDLELLLEEYKKVQKKFTTNVSRSYLEWRYQDVPVAEYVAIGLEKGSTITGLILGRIKQSRFGRELRLTDYFWRENTNEKELIIKLKGNMKEWGIDYATVSGTQTRSSKKVFDGFYGPNSIGPMVTLRTLALRNLTSWKNFNQWSPSLGDLELF